MKFFVVVSLFFISICGHAAQKKSDTNAVMAKATASFTNRMSNVEEFLNVMSKSVSPEQMDNFKKQLTLNGITGKTKFPKMKYDGNKAFFDKNNYIMYVDEKTVNINGVEFKKGVKGIDLVYKDIVSKIGGKSASRFSVLPEAHAFSTFGGLVGMLGSGALGYFLGPAIGVSAGWGAALGAGAFFLGNELYESWRDGEVSCANGYYEYRSKSREGGIFASNTKTPLDATTLSRIFGPNVPPCTPASAKMVQNGIQKFGGLPQPQGYPPYQGYQQPAALPQPADVSQPPPVVK